MLRPVLTGISTVGLSVALAAAAPNRLVGGTHELMSFAVWSVPLGLILALFSVRPRFLWLPAWARGAAAATFGLLAGIGLTFTGWIVIGGWMLAWDFPVLYSWALAASLTAVVVTWSIGSIRVSHGIAGLVSAVAPLVLLGWIASRPTPAVLIVCRDHPTEDAAQLVLDSVLTVPYPSGGREIRWPHSSYARVATSDGHTAALIGLRGAEYRDSIRSALAGHPLVIAVNDTTMQ